MSTLPRRYYEYVAGIPIVLWYIPDGFLPDFCQVKQQIDPEVNDVCHHNIVGLTATQAENIFAKVWKKPDEFVVCTEEGERPLTREDILEWQRLHPQNK